MMHQRSSRALDHATRRLAGIKTIDPLPDFGGDLTVVKFDEMIAQVRTTLDVHNGLVSKLNENSVQLRVLEKQLNAYSDRFREGVAAKYGKDSTEYVKAGGKRTSDRKRPVRKPESPPKP